MKTFRFTYTRCTLHGDPIEHVVDTIAAWTLKSAKHALVKRFGLQNWTPWRTTETGGCVKTQTSHASRGKLLLEEL